MRDIVYLALTVGFFALSALYVGGCARIIGREELTAAVIRDDEASDETDVAGVRQ